MKKMITVVLCLVAYAASADHIKFKRRCSEDSLDIAQAVERIEWAARCNHITTEERYDALYTGANGASRPRPEYPLFATADLGAFWRAPVARAAACDVPAGYGVQGFCTASCYTPEQVVLFPEGFVPILEAKQRVIPSLMSLADFATLDNLTLREHAVESYTEEVKDTWHNLVAFQMKSGGTLRVTENHPVLDAKGEIREASTFKVGDALIHYQHGVDPVEAIEKLRYYGKVYNLAPQTSDPVSHIIVAQGYLNGSSYYQNDGVNFLNREVLRRNLPLDLIQ